MTGWPHEQTDYHELRFDDQDVHCVVDAQRIVVPLETRSPGVYCATITWDGPYGRQQVSGIYTAARGDPAPEADVCWDRWGQAIRIEHLGKPVAAGLVPNPLAPPLPMWERIVLAFEAAGENPLRREPSS